MLLKWTHGKFDRTPKALLRKIGLGSHKMYIVKRYLRGDPLIKLCSRIEGVRQTKKVSVISNNNFESN